MMSGQSFIIKVIKQQKYGSEAIYYLSTKEKCFMIIPKYQSHCILWRA